MGTVGALQAGSTTFGWQLQNATPAGLAVLWVGFSNRFAGGQALLPFDLGPLGAPGCRIFAADDAVHFRLADANGAATLPMGIPNDPSLRLLPLFGQGATLAAGANALGLLVGNAVVARIP